MISKIGVTSGLIFFFANRYNIRLKKRTKNKVILNKITKSNNHKDYIKIYDYNLLESNKLKNSNKYKWKKLMDYNQIFL